MMHKGRVSESKPHRKKHIPASLRRQVWLSRCGECYQAWCLCCYSQRITVFDFHCGHQISEHNGGETVVKNLYPVCALCNYSMRTQSIRDFQAACHYRPSILMRCGLNPQIADLARLVQVALIAVVIHSVLRCYMISW